MTDRPIVSRAEWLSARLALLEREKAFNRERDAIVREVRDRVVAEQGRSAVDLEVVLNETAHQEVERLEKQRDEEAEDNLSFWRGLTRGIARMDDGTKRDVLTKIVGRMTSDVAGNFDPRVYWFAQRIVPPAVAAVPICSVELGADAVQALSDPGPHRCRWHAQLLPDGGGGHLGKESQENYLAEWVWQSEQQPHQVTHELCPNDGFVRNCL